MKRGLKDDINTLFTGDTMVEETSPMKRGLKVRDAARFVPAVIGLKRLPR